MPPASNTSFIPKRNPAKKDKVTTRKQVYVGTLVIRVLFLAVIVASGALYLYEKKLNSDLNKAINELDTRINSFNEADMARVISVDKRLRQANSRLQNSASMVSVLQAIEQSTTEATEINSLNLSREDDNVLALTLSLEARSFDSVKFQREVLSPAKVPKISSSEVSNLVVTNSSEEADFLTSATEDGAQIEIVYNALLNIKTQDVRHTPLLPEGSGNTDTISTEVFNNGETSLVGEENTSTDTGTDSNQTDL